MKRREFILATAGFATLTTFSLSSCSRETPVHLAQPSELGFIMEDKEDLVNLGTAYRKVNPEDDDKDRLVAILEKDFDNRSSTISSQFQKGELHQINGWILSHYEACQCALLSIIS